MTLLGPADADHFRVKVGRYGDRWYCDPLPADATHEATDNAWPSVSTVKKASGSDWTFVSLRRVADALEANPHQLDGLDHANRYERLKAINTTGLRKAGERGTNVHRYFEQGLRGQDITPGLFPDEPGAEYLDAVRAFFDAYQPELAAAEFVAIDRDLHGIGYGGTGDAIVRIGGKAYLVDWKSRGADSDHGAYPEEAAQIAAYAGAQYLIVEGVDGPERQPVPHLDGGLIVSIKPDGFRCYPVDLGAAWKHWVAMHAWWTARRDERVAIGRPWAPRKLSTVEPTPVAGVPGVAPVEQGAGACASPAPADPFDGLTEALSAQVATWGEAIVTSMEQNDDGLPAAHAPAPADRVEWLRQRAAAVLADEKAKDTLLRRWPEGVPTFKQGGHTMEHAALIEALLDSVEADYEMPFGAPPPAEPKVEPDDPFAGLNGEATKPDEGPTVDPDDIAALSRIIAQLGDDRVVLDAWASATFLDGGRSISVKLGPTRWRYAIARALTLAVRAGVTTDDDLRTVLYGATLCEDVLMPAIPVGKAIAALTIEEADRAAHIAQHLGTPDLALSFDEAGKPVFTGTAYDGLHAA